MAHLFDENVNVTDYLLSVGIDFGTSNCAVAYSFYNSPGDVHVFRNWPDATPTLGKVPTDILFDAEQRCIEFGYGALKKFREFVYEEKDDDLYLFQNFKMALYNEKNINREMLLCDVSGKTMRAIDVFTAVIMYIKDQVLNDIKHRRSSMVVPKHKIKWVITVPAIWCDAAKQFMRKAAERAGCRSRSITIALEPEAASIYCQQSSIVKKSFSQINDTKKNVKYLVIDIGGGTVDITALETVDDRYLKEIYRVSGGGFGGQEVDRHFEQLMQTLFSRENIHVIKKSYPDEWLRIKQDFQDIKKQMRPADHLDGKSVSIFISNDCPWNKKHFHQLPNDIKEGIRLTQRGGLFLPARIILSMIKHVSRELRCHVTQLLGEPELKELDCIFMVGGFSNSHVIVNDIKELAEDHGLPVIVPEDAELSVIKGAVLFGWKTKVLRSRKSRKTYGISISDRFIDGLDEETRAFYDSDGKKWCIDCFYKLVSIDEDIFVDNVVTYEAVHTDDEAAHTTIELYSSENPDPRYTYEDGVSLIGEIEIPRAVNARGKGVTINVYFRNTEIKIDIIDETSGNLFTEKFDFMSQTFVKYVD